jgi:putative transposase
LLLEQNDEWALQRRYMTLETLAVVGDNPNVSLSAVDSLTGNPTMPESMTS